MEEENKRKEYVAASIISNIIEVGNFLGFPYRRWAEAIGFTGLFILIIALVPFTFWARFFICLVYGFAIFTIALNGIKNRSIVQFFMDEKRFRKNKRILHLRGPEFIKAKADISSYEGGDDFFGRQIDRIKERIIQGADKILDETTGKED